MTRQLPATAFAFLGLLAACGSDQSPLLTGQGATGSTGYGGSTNNPSSDVSSQGVSTQSISIGSATFCTGAQTACIMFVNGANVVGCCGASGTTTGSSATSDGGTSTIASSSTSSSTSSSSSSRSTTSSSSSSSPPPCMGTSDCQAQGGGLCCTSFGGPNTCRGSCNNGRQQVCMPGDCSNGNICASNGLGQMVCMPPPMDAGTGSDGGRDSGISDARSG